MVASPNTTITTLRVPVKVNRPAVVTDPPGKVPKKIVRQLPMLMAAARDPEAPIALKAMYRMIVRRLEREMKGG